VDGRDPESADRSSRMRSPMRHITHIRRMEYDRRGRDEAKGLGPSEGGRDEWKAVVPQRHLGT
jgi:hypothetical protein